MKLKHIRNNIWQVNAYIESPDEHGIDRAPITIRFAMEEGDAPLVFIRGWIWSAPAEDDSIWMLKSWLEVAESEIRDLAGIEEPA